MGKQLWEDGNHNYVQWNYSDGDFPAERNVSIAMQ